MEFSERRTESYKNIIQYLSPPSDQPTSSAEILNELDEESAELEQAIRDLIAFGALELVNTSQYFRIRLRGRSNDGQLTLSSRAVWYAYITAQEGDGRTRARRVFSNQEDAEQHILQLINKEKLTAVPIISDVWCAQTKGKEMYLDEYAVVRREPVYQNAPEPHRSH